MSLKDGHSPSSNKEKTGKHLPSLNRSSIVRDTRLSTHSACQFVLFVSCSPEMKRFLLGDGHSRDMMAAPSIRVAVEHPKNASFQLVATPKTWRRMNTYPHPEEADMKAPAFVSSGASLGHSSAQASAAPRRFSQNVRGLVTFDSLSCAYLYYPHRRLTVSVDRLLRFRWQPW